MSAKHKLNSAYFLGIIVIAGVIGALTGSWVALVLTAAALLVAAVLAGDIRR